MRNGYSVTVSQWGEQVVTIEENMLAGREISDADAEAIRTAAAHLLSFAGPAEPQPCFACGGVEECEGDCPLWEPVNTAG